MTATRVFPDETTHPSDITGSALATLQKAEGDALWNGVISQVGSIGGTADAITGTCTPALTASYADGQTFRLVPASNNTSTVTVNIDSRGAKALHNEDGDALAADDIVADRPIEFWFDEANDFFRLSNATEQDLSAAAIASFTQQWEEIGDTTVGGAVAQVEHTFVAGTYCKIIVMAMGISPSGSVAAPVITLRNASGAIVTLQSAETTNNASDNATVEATFIIDLVTATANPVGALWGHVDSTPIAQVFADGASATAADRVRVAWSSGNIDAGRIISKGLKQ